MREFLKGLELDRETIDTIMAEHGKIITGLRERNQELESKNKELTDQASESTKIQEELETLRNEKSERTLNDQILEALGDKKFVNDFTKKAVIDEIKKNLKDESNKGKSVNDILQSFTEGKEDIFVSEPNVSRATGTQAKGNVTGKETGVSAILKAKHPDLF